ncbi:Phosphatidylinositol 4-phosphate 5-kinase 10 [Linum perenne]
MRQHKVHYAKQDNKRLPRFGNSNEFELKDYCSEVFRRIQDLKNVDNYEYMQSVFTDQTLKEIISTKKTGCLGPLSRDDRFFIKTLRKSEVKAIIEMLPSYYFHLKKNPSTLLSALYGVHVVKPIAGGSKVYFGVLSNVIPSDVNMYRIYDLKGSSRGRPVKKVRDHVNIISKDPDFDFKFYLDPSIHERLLSQIKSDCEFLETEGVMGYSLCLGVPVKNSCQGVINYGSLPFKKPVSNCSSPTHSMDGTSSIASADGLSSTADSLEDFELNFVDTYVDMQESKQEIKLGAGMSARPVHLKAEQEGLLDPGHCEVMLYFAIVDIFRNYGMAKHIEHGFKSLWKDSQSMSAVNPKIYSSRFQEFLYQIFRAQHS